MEPRKTEISSSVQQRFTGFFTDRAWQAFPFQQQVLDEVFSGTSGLLNAPTGSGKTIALALPLLLKYSAMRRESTVKGLQIIWITPIRALAPEISAAFRDLIQYLDLPWRVENRTGDTNSAQRAKQKKNPPEVLITTPESLHILLSQKSTDEYFGGLQALVVDEWHELLGTKRGVQVELALSRLKVLARGMCIWGVSATIGNLREAMQVLLGNQANKGALVMADIQREMEITTLIPEEVERFPWSGHLGLSMLPQLLPVLESAGSTLVFTNTRGQAEIWYQQILAARPDWAGIIALHHGSLSTDIRTWVEESLHAGRLKVVVCTSSLDLGVDFRPVETVVQIGSPKGVSRFAQRAGRSGHRPGAVSRIFIVPTHALELLEAVAIKTAVAEKRFEERLPVFRAFDVLIQYLVTLAVGDGFDARLLRREVQETYCFQTINDAEWAAVLSFITTGGDSLQAYSEFSRVIIRDGIYCVEDRKTAQRHRLSIGTIASELSIQVTLMNGKRLGTIEEYFIARLNEGDAFVFAGQLLELVSFRGTQAIVKKASGKSNVVPSWNGGRMPLSSEVSQMLRMKLNGFLEGDITDVEMEALVPLLQLQMERSAIPEESEILMEVFHSKEGTHFYIYPFEGRLVHEGMAMLFAYRLARISPASFSIGMNDYGFELLTDSVFDFTPYLDASLFSTAGLTEDIYASTNYSEIARRRFRDIAGIAGLLFKGFPGRQQKARHLQANSNLFYEVFRDYDHSNLLLKQSLEEALYFQLEERRLRQALQRMGRQRILLKYLQKPSPFCFPLLVDNLRAKLSNESLEDRVKKMIARMEAS